MPNIIETENYFVSELVPQGFNSWTAYYRHQERMEKVKYWAQGFLGAFILLIAYILNGYINYMWGC